MTFVSPALASLLLLPLLLFSSQSTESARDFLLNKLQDAEFAIKSSMAEQATLQKQAETDHEVGRVEGAF